MPSFSPTWDTSILAISPNIALSQDKFSPEPPTWSSPECQHLHMDNLQPLAHGKAHAHKGPTKQNKKANKTLK